MKKSLVIMLAVVFVLGIAATAFAAANPFVDVPAKHWAYESVAKLAKAGIVTGYGDGTFRGDRTMTRYEMAAIVAKAMANQDKANAEQKAEIAKLEAEFSDELSKLGVRVTALENKVGNIKFTGQVRERYEWVKEPASAAGNPAETTRLLLFMNAPLTDDLNFNARYYAQGSNGAGATTMLDQAYLTGKAFGNGNFVLGRQGITLGKGLVYNWNPNNDGVSFTVGDQVKFTGAAFKHDIGTAVGLGTALNINMLTANVDWAVNKDFDLTAVYAKSKSQDLSAVAGVPFNGDLIKTWAVGFGYNGIQNIGLTFEYGKNTSDAAKGINNNTDAKAWLAKAKYMGADNAKPQSYGLWVGYRKADAGFFGHNGDPLWETAGNLQPTNGYLFNNIKGFDYGFEYTVFKNGILSLQYSNLKSADGLNTNANNFTAQLIYSF